MTLIVQIESGLHEGAEHLIEVSEFSIGSSESADIFLSDVGVPEKLLQVVKSNGQWIVTHLDSSAILSDSVDSLVGIQSPINQTIYLSFGLIRIKLNLHTPPANKVESGEFQALVENKMGSADVNSKPKKSHTLSLLVFVCFGLFLAGSLATSGYVSARNFGHNQAAGQHELKDIESSRFESPVNAVYAKNVAAKHAIGPSDGVIQSLQEILQDTRSKLGDTELFEVALTDGELQIQARLSRRQLQLFEQSLLQLGMDFGDQIPIRVTVFLNSEQQIIDEISVRQVVMGNLPFVVLSDGTTLFAGSAYMGLTLSSINFDKLEFKGQQTYVTLI